MHLSTEFKNERKRSIAYFASPQAVVDTIQYSGPERLPSVMSFKLIGWPQLLNKRHLIKTNHSVPQRHLLAVTIQYKTHGNI